MTQDAASVDGLDVAYSVGMEWECDSADVEWTSDGAAEDEDDEHMMTESESEAVKRRR